MQKMTASRAKQNFGELLEALALGPVAIERHRKVKAIVCAPEAFRDQSGPAAVLSERRAARAAQLLLEKDRLIKHQRLAIELLVMPRAQSQELIRRARTEVAKWRLNRLCSSDYSDRWEELLKKPVAELALAMGSDTLDWGPALRQNSPWYAGLP